MAISTNGGSNPNKVFYDGKEVTQVYWRANPDYQFIKVWPDEANFGFISWRGGGGGVLDGPYGALKWKVNSSDIEHSEYIQNQNNAKVFKYTTELFPNNGLYWDLIPKSSNIATEKPRYVKFFIAKTASAYQKGEDFVYKFNKPLTNLRLSYTNNKWILTATDGTNNYEYDVSSKYYQKYGIKILGGIDNLGGAEVVWTYRYPPTGLDGYGGIEFWLHPRA